jgi:hypothetical protein
MAKVQRDEFKLELIEPQMVQKPILRAEVHALASRASSNS